MAFRFSPAHPIADEILRVVREQIDDAIERLDDDDIPVSERVHLSRTACKKVRATLQLIRPAQRKTWKRQDAWWRDTARELADLRDAAAMPQTLTALLKQSTLTARSPGVAAVRRQLLARRRECYSDDAVQSGLRAVRRRLNDGRKQLKHEPIDPSVADAMKAFAETYRQARRAWQDVQAEPSTEAFHRWRRRTKSHAYQVRLFRCAWPALMCEWQTELRLLGRVLGEEHDLAMLDDAVRDCGSSVINEAQPLLHFVALRRAGLQAEATALAARLFAEKPAAVARRVSAWWTAAGGRR